MWAARNKRLERGRRLSFSSSGSSSSASPPIGRIVLASVGNDDMADSLASASSSSDDEMNIAEMRRNRESRQNAKRRMKDAKEKHWGQTADLSPHVVPKKKVRKDLSAEEEALCEEAKARAAKQLGIGSNLLDSTDCFISTTMTDHDRTVWESKVSFFFSCVKVLGIGPFQFLISDATKAVTIAPKALEDNLWKIPAVPHMARHMQALLEGAHGRIVDQWRARCKEIQERQAYRHASTESSMSLVRMPHCPSRPKLMSHFNFTRSLLWKLWHSWPRSEEVDVQDEVVRWMHDNLSEIKQLKQFRAVVDAKVAEGIRRKMELARYTILDDYPGFSAGNPGFPPGADDETKHDADDETKDVGTADETNDEGKADTNDEGKADTNDEGKAETEGGCYSQSKATRKRDIGWRRKLLVSVDLQMDRVDESVSGNKEDGSTVDSLSASKVAGVNGDEEEEQSSVDGTRANSGEDSSDDSGEASSDECSSTESSGAESVNNTNDCKDEESFPDDSSHHKQRVLEGLELLSREGVWRPCVSEEDESRWQQVKDVVQCACYGDKGLAVLLNCLAEQCMIHHNGAPLLAALRGVIAESASSLYRFGRAHQDIDDAPPIQIRSRRNRIEFTPPGKDFVCFARDCLQVRPWHVVAPVLPMHAPHPLVCSLQVQHIMLLSLDFRGVAPVRWQWDYRLCKEIGLLEDPNAINNEDLQLKHRAQLVCLVLSAATADEQCIRGTVNLHSAGLLDFKKLKHASIGRIKSCIRGCGIQEKKATFLREIARVVDEQHKKILPCDFESLLKLPGVARKTIILQQNEAFGLFTGIGADVHVMETCAALEFVDAAPGCPNLSPEIAEASLREWVDRRHYKDVNKIVGSFAQLFTRSLSSSRDRPLAAKVAKASTDFIHSPYHVSLLWFMVSRIRSHYSSN